LWVHVKANEDELAVDAGDHSHVELLGCKKLDDSVQRLPALSLIHLLFREPTREELRQEGLAHAWLLLLEDGPLEHHRRNPGQPLIVLQMH